jgi:membrane-bound ClpP family serine protease
MNKDIISIKVFPVSIILIGIMMWLVEAFYVGNEGRFVLTGCGCLLIGFPWYMFEDAYHRLYQSKL